jgi:hypothetical protein
VGEGSAVLHRTDGGFACNATLEDVDIDTTLTLPDSQFNALNQQLRVSPQLFHRAFRYPELNTLACPKSRPTRNFENFIEVTVHCKGGIPTTHFTTGANDVKV